MHWPTVVQRLRAEADKDLSRAMDLERVKDNNGAALLRLASIVSSRLALAFEAGHVKAGEKPLPEDVKRKEGSGRVGKTPGERPVKRTRKKYEDDGGVDAANWGTGSGRKVGTGL